MNTVDKKAFISDLYQRTEAILQSAVTQYQNLDEASLNFTSDVKSWNIGQVLSHLNSYGNYYLPQLENIIAQKQALSLSAYTPSWLGKYFVNMMDVNNSNKRFKAAKKHQPHVSNAYVEVAEFISQQERMLQCIKAFEKIDISRTRIPISIAKLIKLNVGDLLSFLVTHNERHMVQIKNIQRQQATALSQRAVLTSFAS